jgi:tetratricopeptide (TPR) repeat protein
MKSQKSLLAMKKTSLIALFSLGSIIVTSCGTVAIRSSPADAEISLMQPGRADPKPLGKTPYEGKLGDLGSAANSGPIVLQIKKPGYITQNLYVPNASGSRIEFDTNLKPVNPGSFADMNKIVKLVLQAEREIMMKQVDEALKTASNIKAINDNIAMAWEIEGAAYFVKGDLAKAKVSWLRSLEIDPENPETTKMLGTIDEKLGTKN